MTLVSLPSALIVPMPDLFWHPGNLHGQAHVTRVMVHAARLVAATGQWEHAARLWAAVFLHDIARRHDGTCYRHGADAAQRLRDEAALQNRLAPIGLSVADYPAIESAVTAHSAPKEVPRTHPHWSLIALLKDADGLDRVRLGDLDRSRLRHPEARAMVPFAQALFDGTDGLVPCGEEHFESVCAKARLLR